MSLFEAVRSQDFRLFNEIIERERHTINETNEDAVTCLHVAAGLEDITFLEILLEHGAQVDSVTTDGLTPLHVAAMWGKSENVQILLNHGASISLKDGNGFDANMHALNSSVEGSDACVDLISDRLQSMLLPNASNARMSSEEKSENQESSEFITACCSPDVSELHVATCTSPKQGIDFERLTGSPWITPRNRKRREKARDKSNCDKNMIGKLQFEDELVVANEDLAKCSLEDSGAIAEERNEEMKANEEKEPNIDHNKGSFSFTQRNFSCSSFSNEDKHCGIDQDAIKPLPKLEFYEDYLTEMSLDLLSNSGTGSTINSSSATFSYSTISCLQEHKSSIQNTQFTLSEDSVSNSSILTDDSLSQVGNESVENFGKQNEMEKEDIKKLEQRNAIVEKDEDKNSTQHQLGKEKEATENEAIPSNNDSSNKNSTKLHNLSCSKPLNSTFTVGTSSDNHSKPQNFFIPMHTNTSISNPIPKAKTNTSEPNMEEGETIVYDWKDCSHIADLDQESIIIPPNYVHFTSEEIRQKIVSFGQTPGPITPHTKQLYLRKLCKLEQGRGSKTSKNHSPLNQYPPELRMILTGRSPVPDLSSMEEEMMTEFNHPSKKAQWRGGNEKSSFNYLLLDPRVSLNLPSRYKDLSKTEAFRCFVLSVFYVGKGKRSRPYAHLHEAIKCHTNGKTNKKVSQICDIWSAGLGVISLHIFQNTIPVEAFTREACMVDALGLSQLTNQKRGEYYGLCSKLPLRKKRSIGILFLYKALQIFLQEGERQIGQADV